MTKEFKFHSDSGHGWLAVKSSLIEELGLVESITSCSYMKGSTSYLEEDVDMSKFITAYTVKFGTAPVIIDLKSKDRSPIRSFNRFEMGNRK